jgi:hemoglobin
MPARTVVGSGGPGEELPIGRSPMREAPIFRSIASADITAPLVREVMESFYEDVRADPVLGAVFREAIGDGDWSAHIEKVVGFWLTMLRIERTYRGRDFMPAHLRHGHIRAEHASLWLALFDKTINRLCRPKEAEAFRAIAVAMIENLEIALAKRDGAQA